MACESDESNDASPVQTYATRFAEAVCGTVEPCCRENGISFDSDSCLLASAAFTQTGVDTALAVGATFDAEAADACIAAAARAMRACAAIHEDPEARLACSTVFVGVKEAGEPCEQSLECGPSRDGFAECALSTSRADGGTLGRCVVYRQPASVGDLCHPLGSDTAILADCAASGLYCDVATGRCAAPLPTGADCPGPGSCEDGSYCDAQRVCAPEHAADEPCSSDVECAEGVCLRDQCAKNGVGLPAVCAGASN